MLLAGGVAAVAACSGSISSNAGSPGAPTDDASDEGTNNSFPTGCSSGCNFVTDPCVVDPQSCADAAPDAAPSDASVDAPVSLDGAGCCNANPDPCCAHQFCGGPLTPECSAELACQADGGTYDYVDVPQPDGSYAPIGCVLPGPDAAPDSGPPDGGAEAAADAAPDVVYSPFCCNANPDPCCQYLYCGGSLTPECTAELACQADGGTYDPWQITQPDGSVTYPSCSFPEAGPDATPDSEPSDAGGG
jgi:hypothetical protein